MNKITCIQQFRLHVTLYMYTILLRYSNGITVYNTDADSDRMLVGKNI